MTIEDCMPRLIAGLDRDEAAVPDWMRPIRSELEFEVYPSGEYPHICVEPRRILRQVEAIRKVIAEHADNGQGKCLTCSKFYAYPCPTLRALASIYTEDTDAE